MIALSWSPEAKADLAGMDAYYRPLNFAFAQRALAAAVDGATFLVEHPRAGQIVEKTDYRKWRVQRTPYSLIYRETSTQLRIVRVVHAASNRQALL